MAQVNDFVCDRCGTSCKDAVIHDPVSGADVAVPMVLYLVIGVPPGTTWCPKCDHVLGRPDIVDGRCRIHNVPIETGAVDLTHRALPPLVREVLEQPISRIEWCLPCAMKDLGLKLERRRA